MLSAYPCVAHCTSIHLAYYPATHGMRYWRTASIQRQDITAVWLLHILSIAWSGMRQIRILKLYPDSIASIRHAAESDPAATDVLQNSSDDQTERMRGANACDIDIQHQTKRYCTIILSDCLSAACAVFSEQTAYCNSDNMSDDIQSLSYYPATARIRTDAISSKQNLSSAHDVPPYIRIHILL